MSTVMGKGLASGKALTLCGFVTMPKQAHLRMKYALPAPEQPPGLKQHLKRKRKGPPVRAGL